MRSLKEALIRKSRNVGQTLSDIERRENIIKFLTTNYDIKKNDIEIISVNNEFIVNIMSRTLSLINSETNSLTGGLFKFGIIYDLTIEDCNKLVDLSGLQDADMKGSLRILDCNKLKNLTGLPPKFHDPGTCYSNIFISDCNNFESLEGCPIEVSDLFTCKYCPKLKNLKYMPKFRDNDEGYILLVQNKSLNNLQGIDKDFCGDISLNGCISLKSLHGCPKKLNSFECINCTNLETLEGGPEVVKDFFDCSKCVKLTDLNGAPSKVGGEFKFDYCKGLLTIGGHPDKVGAPLSPVGIPKISQQILNRMYYDWVNKKRK